MARLFLTNIDLKGNQLVNVVLHSISGSSGLSTTPGAMYYDSGTNKFQFRNASGWIGYLPDTTTLATISAPAGSVSLNSQKITNLLDPTDAQDAATKAYVDGLAQGLDVKGSVRAATTANITLTSTQTIDTVALSVGERVLVKNQTTGSENGIYTVGAGSWARAADAVQGKLTSGAFVFVEEGNTNQNSGWVLTTDGTITVGTTALAWDQFSGAGQITAGDGLTKNGNTINFVGAANGGLTVNNDSVQVNASQLFIGTSNVVVGATGGAQALAGITSVTGTTADMTVQPATRTSGTGYNQNIYGGLSSSGQGGQLRLYGGNGTSGNGGNVLIDGGTGTAVGSVNIGTASAAINIGQASVSTTVISGATRLAALTSNGFVKTTGSNGALSIDTTVALTTNTLGVFAATTSSQLAGVISDETGFNSTGVLVFSTGPTISLPIINNIKIGYTTTVTSGTAQTIDVNANRDRFYTGSTAQTVVLPVASTLSLGMSYEFHNNSTAVLTIQSSGLNTVVTVPPATTVRVTCILTSGTDAASWDFDYTGQNSVPIRKVAGTIALTGGTAAAITHNLNTREVTVQMWETSSSLPTQVVEMDVANTSATVTTVTSSLTGTYYYVIMG
jgi:hypothetical protein